MNLWAKIVLPLLLSIPAAAQQPVSVRAGAINHAEGFFYLDQELLQFPEARFREIPVGKSLRTGMGWVELQLGPNACLWLGENGVLRMEDPSLTSIQLLVEQGSIVLWIQEKSKENRVRIRFKEAIFEPRQNGFYRLDSLNSRLRVFYGRADIRRAGEKATVKSGKAVVLTEKLKASKFDAKQVDQLDQIASRRSLIVYREFMMARENRILQAAGGRGQKSKTEIFDASSKAYLEDTGQQRRWDYDEARRQQEVWKTVIPQMPTWDENGLHPSPSQIPQMPPIPPPPPPEPPRTPPSP
jgi:hypothetical protein